MGSSEIGAATVLPVVPLLSIRFETPPATPTIGKTDDNNNNKSPAADVGSVIPSLMSLTLSPPSPTYAPFSVRSLRRNGHRQTKSSYDEPKEVARCFEIVEVERTNKTRREFAHIAREVTRENFEPPAGTKLLFAYYTYPNGKKELIGVASFQEFNAFSSKAGDKEDSDLFVYDYYNIIHYVFMLRDFRGFGYGRRMIESAEKRFRVSGGGGGGSLPRPIRVQAGTRAVGFFEALGYRRVSVGKDSICCGTPLFRTLYNMTKTS